MGKELVHQNFTFRSAPRASICPGPYQPDDPDTPAATGLQLPRVQRGARDWTSTVGGVTQGAVFSVNGDGRMMS